MFHRTTLAGAVILLLLGSRSATATLVVHFDPNELSSQFEDSVGTNPVEGVGDGVQFVTDARSPTPGGAALDGWIDAEANADSPVLIAHATQGTVWDFNGANSRMLAKPADVGTIQDGFGTQFHVDTMTAIVAGYIKPDGVGTDYLFDMKEDGNSIGFGMRYRFTNNELRLQAFSNHLINANVDLAPGEWFVATYVWDGSLGSATLSIETQSGVSSDTNAAGTSALSNVTEFRVGTRTASSSGGTRFWGQMGDIMIYNDVADHSAVADQLADDYLNLPELLIDRGTGEISISNNSSTDITNVIGYSMTSAAGTLDPSQWLSITDNYDASGSPPTQVDPDNNWTELTSSESRHDLSETEFEGAGGLSNGADFLAGSTTSLGNAWIQYYNEDLAIELLYDDGTILPLGVRFTGNGDSPFQFGDLDFDGDVDEDDFYNEFMPNYGADTSALSSGAERYQLGDLDEDGTVSFEDFFRLDDAYTAANPGAASLSFRSTVPEPTTLMLLAIAAAGLVLGHRHSV